MRAGIIGRIESADEQALQDVAAMPNVQDDENAPFTVPEWQQEEMQRRVANHLASPKLLIPRDTAEAMIRKSAHK